MLRFISSEPEGSGPTTLAYCSNGIDWPASKFIDGKREGQLASEVRPNRAAGGGTANAQQ